jgi:predicted metal-binding protein
LEDLREYWERLCRGKPAEAKEIDPSSVVTAAWVRLKCRFGCEGYGRGYCCPPDTPSPEQTREILNHYHRALLFHYRAAKRDGENRIKVLSGFFEELIGLEGELFKDGFYKAFVMLAGPCSRCSPCAKAEGAPCRFGAQARPSMEACGIDVYRTAWNNDFPIKPLRHKEETQDIFCLMLVE